MRSTKSWSRKKRSSGFFPLDEPADIPREEKSEDFVAALQQAKVSNIEYLTKLEVLESQGRDDDIALAKLDRELRDLVRTELGLPPRLKKNEINRAEHARSLSMGRTTKLLQGIEEIPQRSSYSNSQISRRTRKRDG